MKVFLLGFMGSGKTTVGNLLADQCGFGFADTDALIEERTGMSVYRFFLQHGEAEFRKLEHEIIVNIAGLDLPLVVATGGGLPCFMDHIQLINRSGFSIYLRLPAAQLALRLEGKAKYRPMISDVEDIDSAISTLLKQREAVYSQARMVHRPAPEEDAEQTTRILFQALQAAGLLNPGRVSPG